MKDRDLIDKLRAIIELPAREMRAEIQKLIDSLVDECPYCCGMGWTGYSEISGEQCDECDGSGVIPSDEAINAKRR